MRPSHRSADQGVRGLNERRAAFQRFLPNAWSVVQLARRENLLVQLDAVPAPVGPGEIEEDVFLFSFF